MKKTQKAYDEFLQYMEQGYQQLSNSETQSFLYVQSGEFQDLDLTAVEAVMNYLRELSKLPY